MEQHDAGSRRRPQGDDDDGVQGKDNKRTKEIEESEQEKRARLVAKNREEQDRNSRRKGLSPREQRVEGSADPVVRTSRSDKRMDLEKELVVQDRGTADLEEYDGGHGRISCTETESERESLLVLPKAKRREQGCRKKNDELGTPKSEGSVYRGVCFACKANKHPVHACPKWRQELEADPALRAVCPACRSTTRCPEDCFRRQWFAQRPVSYFEINKQGRSYFHLVNAPLPFGVLRI